MGVRWCRNRDDVGDLEGLIEGRQGIFDAQSRRTTGGLVRTSPTSATTSKPAAERWDMDAGPEARTDHNGTQQRHPRFRSVANGRYESSLLKFAPLAQARSVASGATTHV